ncbi:MAG: DUF1648 domain-containing protein [Bacteroidaceae bacterium]|nr:DUF1648 domain-containing protein [Bacteroidaceae bacterium]
MNWKRLFNEQRPSEIYNVRLPVTWTDRILEFIALLLLIAMWVVAAVFYRQAEGADVATHFNFAGEIDQVSDPVSILVTTLCWTFVMLMVGLSAYRPRLMNPSVRITTVKQLKLAVTQMRGMNIILGIMGICLLLSMVYETPVWVLIPAGLLFIEVITFSILIKRQSNKRFS